MKKKWYRNFAEWNAPAVRDTFDLTRDPASPAFQDWIGARLDLPDVYTSLLERLQSDLTDLCNNWNEMELLARFIAPLLATVGFAGKGYNQYHNRALTATFEAGQTVSGAVDGVVALGGAEPERPFFFLHEYKKLQGYDADPEGQLLIAMVTAQRLNDDGLPLYGCYVIGKFWHFLVLDGKNYAVSQGYDATDPEELRIIWSVLQHTKRIVEERVEAILAAEEP